MTTPRMHTGRIRNRQAPCVSAAPAAQMPAPTTGNSSGMGSPMPEPNSPPNAARYGQIISMVDTALPLVSATKRAAGPCLFSLPLDGGGWGGGEGRTTPHPPPQRGEGAEGREFGTLSRNNPVRERAD